MNDSYDPRKLMELQQMLEEAKARGPASLDIPQEAPPAPEIDPELQIARDQRDKMTTYGNLLRGFQDIVKAGTGFQPSYGVADSLVEQGKQKVTDYKEDQASKVASEKREMEKSKQDKLMEKLSLDIDKSNLDFQNEQEIADPTSRQSQFVQDAYLQMQKTMGNPVNEESVRAASAQELYKVSPWMQDMYSAKLKAELDKAKLGQQEKRIAQADERLDVQREKESGKQKRFERAQDFKEAEKQEISDKQTEQLAGYDEALGLLADADDFKKDVDTGFVTNMSDKVRSFVGKGDIAVSDLKMAIGETLAQKVKALSGTAVSDQERAFIAEVSLPSINDDDEEFKAKLKRAVATLEKARKVRLDSFKKQGKDPSAFEKDGKSPATKKRVVQDGNIFEIDETGNAKFVGKAQ